VEHGFYQQVGRGDRQKGEWQREYHQGRGVGYPVSDLERGTSGRMR
jgi:hypothetical protein